MKIYKKIILALLITVVLAGCKKFSDFGDTNIDPNRTLVPSTNALFTNVLSNISTRTVQLSPGFFCQYFAETQYPTASLYALPQFNMDGIYAGALNDCQKIIELNSNPATALVAAGSNFVNGSNANQIATARILKAYYYWTVTDLWGDIPYSEALAFPNTSPKFDKQEDVYKGLLKELTGAVTQFDGGNKFGGDIVYNGDVNKWKKLANSLRLLISLRMSKRYPGATEYAALEFNAALNSGAGIISSNSDNLKLDYPGGALPNVWNGQYAGGRKDLGEAEPFVTLLNSLNDHRQSGLKYGSSNSGVPFGRNRNFMNNNWLSVFDGDQWSRVLGESFRADNASVNVIHASMVYFARAEAKQIGWTTVNTNETMTAEELYKAGVRASYEQWGLTVAQADTYLGGTNVDFLTGTNQLYKINLQRYIALYPDGLQGWSEVRRTGVPTLTPAIDALNGGFIPRRFVYGSNDYNTNAANLKAAVALLTDGDTEKSRVWWDKP